MEHDGPAVSIIIGTLNRCALLREALDSLLVQRADRTSYEVLVVDNGSADGTRSAIEAMGGRLPAVRYFSEPRLGIAHARNTGVREARAPLLAFMDDDQYAAPQWVDGIVRTFRDYPGISFICGRVRPIWHSRPPAWFSPEVQGAASIIERGQTPRPIDERQWMCVPGGNMACTRAALEAVGGWAPFERSQDRELTVRLLLAGFRGLYTPDMTMYHHVDGGRLTRRRVRRWYTIEGRMRAGYQFLELFDRDGRIHRPEPGRPQWLGISRHVYRGLVEECVGWVGDVAGGNRRAAFVHELRVRHLASYIGARLMSRWNDEERRPGGTGLGRVPGR